ncbi:peroxide stress protein YaaA [Clostridium manihotivorum]|uniref:UPF0246 protein C1I91_07455 n=1 Tax=Clostridium manihotivorum TaxID=2320868 RepID=A0A410DQW0_9CLOT|nr:peroxide stress protein YaaA [Clostridium manihotivorum]QAA31484.1 peroxide stress protein YaaA [Clostridium manihotivorum]
MLMIISPAKTLDFEKVDIDLKLTTPRFLNEARMLIEELRKKTPEDISRLMKLNLQLAELNHTRYFQWKETKGDIDKQAVLAFKGEVYRGLRAYDMNIEELEYADRHLRILSGLYGILRPLDAIKPYRLEMGIKLKNGANKDLYGFWQDKIAKDIDSELENHKEKIILNLASEEYYKAIKNYIKSPVIDITFKDRKAGVYKIIPVYAKKARGLMARYIIKNKVESLEEIKNFDLEDYSYSEEMSSKNNLVFLRHSI